MNIRNLDYIRSKDPKLFEALSDILTQQQNIAQQVNANPSGLPQSPPTISGLKVTGQNGMFHLQITDNGPIYRGISYHAEYADNPAFTNPQPIDMGAARNHTLFLGNGTYYFRAFSAYSNGPPGAPAYHGGSIPVPVIGGGLIGGPALLPPQSSGTGTPGQGLQGPGTAPFRSSTGAVPIRNAS